MASTGKLILLRLGLCSMFCYVNAVDVRIVGGGVMYHNQDMTDTMSSLRERKEYLESVVERRTSQTEKMILETELRDVTAKIAYLEATARVPYKDYLQSTTEERQEFEKEKAEFRKRLEKAEIMRIKAIEELAVQKKEKSDKIDQYVRNLEKLTEERNKIAREYAKFTEAFYKQEQKMKEERDQFFAEKGNLQYLIDEARRKHAQALEAITATPAESHTPFHLPEQDEINKLRRDITLFNGVKNRKKLKEGLETTRKNLKELLDRLYKEGKFSSEIDHEDLKTGLSEMEKNTLLQKEQKGKEKMGIVEKMKQKDLTSYTEELEKLKKTNDEVAELDMFEKEIDRKNAYLKGILEVSDLLEECSDAIRDANDRNLANVWADAIQGAKDSPLAMFWKKKVKNRNRMNGKVRAKQSGSANNVQPTELKDEAKITKSNSIGENYKKALSGAKTTFGKIKFGKEKSLNVTTK